MENQPNNHIESLFEKTGEYIETRIDLLKLKAADKSADVVSSLVSRLVILLIATMFIIILNIGIALLIGEALGKSYYGFFVLAGFYLITGLVFNSFKNKWIKEPVADKLIKKLFK